MSSHLYNLRDTGATHHYDLRDRTASATKDQTLHKAQQPHHPTHDQAGHQQQHQAHAHAHAQPGHHQQSHGQDHTQKSLASNKPEHASVKLATGNETNLEHPVNPEHDPNHPGH
ncbi:hypothetical protein BGX23_006671 [Mortierella sp. AD031]|nr:hypothetical protein BGX23_006671 [Mortierella sp. AD031]KAG0217183.1 hypothetical protein BGX33_011177 [Mortierella sp. NVP41]